MKLPYSLCEAVLWRCEVCLLFGLRSFSLLTVEVFYEFILEGKGKLNAVNNVSGAKSTFEVNYLKSYLAIIFYSFHHPVPSMNTGTFKKYLFC